MKKMKRLFYRLLAVALAFAMSGNLFFIPAFSVENETQYENEVVSEGTTNDNEEGESEEDGTENGETEDGESKDGGTENDESEDIDSEDTDSGEDTEEENTEEENTEEENTEEEDAEGDESESGDFDETNMDDIECFCGYVPTEYDENVPVADYSSEVPQLHGSLPERFACKSDGSLDLPDYIPELKNQNPYGSCWSFATMGAAEISMNKQGYNKGNNDFSELHFAYFHYNSVTDPLGGTAGDTISVNTTNSDYTFLNRGGNYKSSINSLAAWTGAAEENIAPYNTAKDVLNTGLNDTCAFSDVAHVVQYEEININENPELVKQAILDNGAVAISYADGSQYFDSIHDSYYCPINYQSNHAVLVVGWDDGFSKENFESDYGIESGKPASDGAWLVRNSWWVDYVSEESYYGYFWLSYCDQTISDLACSYIFAPADNYDNNYQYDGGRWVREFCIPGSSNISVSNVFTANAIGDEEELKAVSIVTETTPSVDYCVKIYKNLSDSSNPESGEPISEATTEGHFSLTGFHTIQLNNPVTLEHGETFSVVITLTGINGEPYCGMEEPLPYSNGLSNSVSAQSGQSFYKNGSQWFDVMTYYSRNFRIKAFTNNLDKIELQDFELEDEVNDGITLYSGESYKIGIKSYTPADATSRRIQWTSSDNSVAKVDSLGIITPVGTGNCSITGTYSASDGRKIQRSFSVTVIGIQFNLSGEVSVGHTYRLDYSIDAGDKTIDILKNIYFDTSDEDVIQINADDTFTVTGVGNVDISLNVGEYRITRSVVAMITDSYYLNIDYQVRGDGSVKITWDALGTTDDANLTYYLYAGNTRTAPVIYTATEDCSEKTHEFVDDSYKSITAATTARYLLVYQHSYIIDGMRTTGAGFTFSVYVNPAKTTKVTFDANGGNISDSEKTKSVYYLLKYGTLPTPTRTGYSFLGWFDAKTGGKEITADSEVTTKPDHTLYAHWAINQYTVTFDANGGEASETERTINYGATYGTLPTATRVGHIFEGWYTEKIGGTKIEKTSKYDTDTETTLYAHWSKEKYKVSFNANGGEVSEKEKMVEWGEPYGTLPEPKRKGYIFAGWYTEILGGTKILDSSVMNVSAPPTLYAHWDAQKYTVSLDANGGKELEKDSIEVTFDAPYGNFPTVSRDGYTFEGWYTEKTGGNKVESTTVYDIDDDSTLYAHWVCNKYTLFFDGNGGEVTPSSIEVTYDSAFGELPVPTYVGHIFEGWYTEISEGEKATETTVMQDTDDVTLYAHWTAEKHKVSFDANGGECSASDLTVEYGTAYSMYFDTMPVATRKGYIFDGWFLSKTGNENVTLSSTVNATADYVLYAHWTANTYTVTFENSGYAVTPEAVVVTYDSAYGELPIVTKRSFFFDGWYLSNEDFSPENKVSKDTIVTIDSNHTLYAHFVPYKYIVEKPKADRDSGAEVISGTRLSLSTSTYGAKIYYTSDPEIGPDVYEDNGTLYVEAFALSEDMPGFVSYGEVDPQNPPADPKKDPTKYLGEITIYAIAIREGFSESEISEYTYKILNTSEEWGEVSAEDRAKLAEELKEEGLIDDVDAISADDIPNGLWIAGIKDVDYCGSAITFPDMRVYSGKKLLNSATDYSVKYSNNTKAGTATITISGKGNYTGKLTKNFEIQKLNLGKKQGVALEGCNLDINDGVVMAYDNVTMQYNGKIQKATNTVTYVIGEKTLTLKAGTDFVYEYPGTDSKNQTMYPYDPDAFKAATKDTEPYCINIVAKDKGNFTGSTSFTETITDNKPVSKLSYTIKDNSYSSGEVGPDGKVYVMPSVFTVKDGKTELVPNVHFTYYITDNSQPGVATVHITGILEKGYEGEFQKTFKITGTAISKAKVEGIEKSYVYTGKQIEEEILGTLNVFMAATKTAPATTLEEYIVDDETGKGTGDYKVELTNNVKVGTATLTITGMNGYTGSVKKTFKITPYAIPSHVITSYTETKSITETDDFIIAVANEAVFTKGGAVPKISLVDKRIIDSETGEPYELKEGIDYTVKCTNNKSLSDGMGRKAPTVTITGKGNYSGKTSATYAIKGSSLKNVTVTASDVVYKAGKSGLCKPSIVLTDSDGVKLAAGKDYDKNVIYTYAMDMPIDMDNPVEQMINKVSTPVERKEGDLVDSKDIIPAGCEIIATIKGIGCYAGNQSGAGTPSGVGSQSGAGSSSDDSTVSVRFRFVQSDISKATVKVANKLYYNNGVPVELTKDDLSVVVNKQTLQKTDYEIVGYKNNKVKGTASVTIRGLGNYGGTKTVNYKIEGLGLKWLWDILDVG